MCSSPRGADDAAYDADGVAGEICGSVDAGTIKDNSETGRRKKRTNDNRDWSTHRIDQSSRQHPRWRQKGRSILSRLFVIVIEVHLLGRDGEVIGEIKWTTSSDTAPSTVTIDTLWCGEGAEALGRAVGYEPAVGCSLMTALGHFLRR
jgi:hypothetical protein